MRHVTAAAKLGGSCVRAAAVLVGDIVVVTLAVVVAVVLAACVAVLAACGVAASFGAGVVVCGAEAVGCVVGTGMVSVLAGSGGVFCLAESDAGADKVGELDGVSLLGGFF